MDRNLSDQTVFELTDVSYSYLGRFEALRDVCFTIKQGEQIAILGANGSGKSTLLALLDGLIFPDSGTIRAFGNVLTEDSLSLNGGGFAQYFRKKVGFVFQNPDVHLFCPTVFDELAFGPLQLDMPESEIRERVEDILSMFGIENLRDRAPHTLSGGEKKKVSIASILSINPDVLILDEPTSGLDPRTQVWLIMLLNELRELGKTIVLATHDLGIIDEIADRALVVDENHKIMADGDIDKILNDKTLLLKVNLIHEHVHRHGRLLHSHEHGHSFGHRHEHE